MNRHREGIDTAQAELLYGARPLRPGPDLAGLSVRGSRESRKRGIVARVGRSLLWDDEWTSSPVDPVEGEGMVPLAPAPGLFGSGQKACC